MTEPAVFVFAVLAILGTPGPTNMLLATAGATVGFRRAAPLVAGESAGYLISILCFGLLIGPALASVPLMASVLRLCVGAYLLWLAVNLWKQGPVPVRGRHAITLGQVFVTTLLNPKAIVLALAVIPFGSPDWPAYLLAFLVMLVGMAAAWIAFGSLAGRVASALQRTNVVPRVGAVVVAAFALVLVAGPLVRR